MTEQNLKTRITSYFIMKINKAIYIYIYINRLYYAEESIKYNYLLNLQNRLISNRTLLYCLV